MPDIKDISNRPAYSGRWDSLPTVELHRHFEAGLKPDTIARLAARHGLTEVRTRSGQVVQGVDPQDAVAIRRYYNNMATRFGGPDGFSLFADSFGLPISVLRTLDDLEEAAFEQIVDGAESGSLHTELRGSPFSYCETVDASIEEIAAALVHGVQRAWHERQASGTFLMAFSRQKGLAGPDAPEKFRQAGIIAELVARMHHPDHPVGLDMAGFPEISYPPRLFEEALRPAREAGVPLTVHAGEQGKPPDYAAAPPNLIVEAVECLGARRIGHGTSLAASQAARDYIRERGVAVECCPVSNERMGFVPVSQHPLPLFLQEGLRVSLATDDPLMFGPFSVSETFAWIAGPLGLAGESLRLLTRNGLESAFISEERRAFLRERFKNICN
jgi:adenosine deaminase